MSPTRVDACTTHNGPQPPAWDRRDHRLRRRARAGGVRACGGARRAHGRRAALPAEQLQEQRERHAASQRLCGHRLPRRAGPPRRLPRPAPLVQRRRPGSSRCLKINACRWSSSSSTPSSTRSRGTSSAPGSTCSCATSRRTRPSSPTPPTAAGSASWGAPAGWGSSWAAWSAPTTRARAAPRPTWCAWRGCRTRRTSSWTRSSRRKRAPGVRSLASAWTTRARSPLPTGTGCWQPQRTRSPAL